MILSKLSRNRAPRLLALLFVWLCTCSLSRADDEPQQAPALTLVHISDTHVCNLAGLDSRFIEKRQHFGKGREVLTLFLESVPGKTGADAVVITGDLTDFYEAQASDGTMRSGQIEAFAELVGSSPVPVWLTPGNHDEASYWFDGTQYLNGQHNAQKARAAWTRNLPCFKHGTWYSIIRRVGKATYRLIFLDNAFQQDGVPGDLLDRTQAAWLEWQLRQGRDDTNMIFMHVPLPVADTDGDGVRFNEPPAGWPFPDTYQRGLMKILNENPSVVAIFVGHQHSNVIENIPFPAGHRITQIQTGNLQVDANSWRVVRLTEDEVSVSAPGSGSQRIWKAPSRLSERSTGHSLPAAPPAAGGS